MSWQEASSLSILALYGLVILMAVVGCLMKKRLKPKGNREIYKNENEANPV